MAIAETVERPTFPTSLHPGALKEVGYRRAQQNPRKQTFLYRVSTEVLQLQKKESDRLDPAYVFVTGHEDVQSYMRTYEHELKELDGKLGGFGMKLASAGTRLVTWGGRGHAFEIARNRVSVYMYFPHEDKDANLIEFRFIRDGGLVVWDYGEHYITNGGTAKEVSRVDYATGKEEKTLVVSYGGASLSIRDDGELGMTSLH